MLNASGNRSLYDILEVSRTATPEAVRKAYKRLILENHPDKIPPEATETEREAAEQRFREVHSAFEVLSDLTKRRQYDFGMCFLRRRECELEMKAKLDRERKAWEAEQQRRREERLRIIREQQEAKERRWREIRDKMKEEAEMKQAVYDKQKALEEELHTSYQRNHENIVQATRKSLEKVKALEEDLKARKIQPRCIQVVIEFPCAAEAREEDEAEKLLEELRRRNPEWEIRRQAALQRREAWTNSIYSTSSDSSAD